MARTVPSSLTLHDYAMTHHNFQLIEMVQEIDKDTTILNSLPLKRASDTLQDVTGVRGSIPQATWVGLDKGVKANKGNWSQRREGLANLESLAEISKKVQEVAPDPDIARWNNDADHIEGMSETAEKGVLYGNPASNENQILGFMPRFNKITDRNGEYTVDGKTKVADYVTIDAGGTDSGSLCSILMVAYGNNCPSLLYPRFSKSLGMKVSYGDRWEMTQDTEGGKRFVLYDHFEWMLGLSIPDHKTVVRIANIDPTSDTVLGNLTNKIYEAFTVFKNAHKPSVRMYTCDDLTLALRKYRNSQRMTNVFAEKDVSPSGLAKGIDFGGYYLEDCYNMLCTEDKIS